MKNLLILFFTIFGLTLSAQQEAPPQGINYQAVVYSDNGNNQPGLNSPGQVLWNEDIGVQFSILSGSATGTVIYKETHVTSTDEFGMFDLVIGQGLVQGTQSFNMIDWGSGYHFLKVEVDKTGGTDYVEMSNQQLWSVPYALYSGYSSSSGYADSSAYAEIAGNGLTGVVDNGDGTLTFTYYDGSTYTTTVLSGLGSVGPQGPAGADGQDGQDGLSAYEIWLGQGNAGTEQDFLDSISTPFPDGSELGNTIYWDGTTWVVSSNHLYNDGTSVAIGTTTVDNSALLNLNSTSSGILIPRMLESERDLIPNPSEGLLIYQTDNTPGFYYFNGTIWTSFNSNGGGTGGDANSLIYTTNGF